MLDYNEFEQFCPNRYVIYLQDFSSRKITSDVYSNIDRLINIMIQIF